MKNALVCWAIRLIFQLCIHRQWHENYTEGQVATKTSEMVQLLFLCTTTALLYGQIKLYANVVVDFQSLQPPCSGDIFSTFGNKHLPLLCSLWMADDGETASGAMQRQLKKVKTHEMLQILCCCVPLATICHSNKKALTVVAFCPSCIFSFLCFASIFSYFSKQFQLRLHQIKTNDNSSKYLL